MNILSPEEILDDFHRETKNLGLSSRSEYMKLRTKAIAQLAHRDSPDREKILNYYTEKIEDRILIGRLGTSTIRQILLQFEKAILALFPDIEQIRKQVECAFEDWDDTTLPNPVCHCLKREGVDCANVPDDVEACPDFMSKKDIEIEQAMKKERLDNFWLMTELRNKLAEKDIELEQAKGEERIYPCAECGKMMSKDEGGTTFTVCEECWQALKEKK